MKKYDVSALGEILIDFTFAGKNEEGKNLYEENIGGAPANVAAAIAKCGGKSAFIGMTGEDSFGKDCKACLEAIKVETKAMRTTSSQHTTLAFVSLDQKGERHFSFCRNPGADTQLSEADLDYQLLSDSKILHIGSLSLTDEPVKAATLKAIKSVKEAGGLISYDPNWRENLWKGHADALDLIRSIFSYADIIKISDEEMKLLFGELSLSETAKQLHEKGVKLVLITLGGDGVFYSADMGAISGAGGASAAGYDFEEGKLGVPDVKVVDTTGAGDSFTGGLLYRLTRRENPFAFTKAELEEDLRFANAVASICVTRRGAIPALPNLEEVEEFLLYKK